MTYNFSTVLALSLAIVTASCNKSEQHVPAFPSSDVTIKTDIHGIPHIYGQNDDDVIYGQGYMMATLRGSQNELFRVQSYGRSSEIYGEGRRTEDMLLRAMNFQGFAIEHWQEFQDGWPVLASAMSAFAAGINKKYEEYRKNGWPRTFQILIDRGYSPTDWTATEVLGVAQLLGFGLSGNPEIKLLTTIGLLLLGEDLGSDLIRFEPPVDCVSAPGFSDGLTIPETAVINPITSKRQSLSKTSHPLAELSNSQLMQLNETIKALKGVSLSGSNNWAVHGDKMANGISVLESDTHQGLPIPGAYVLMHLISKRNGGNGSQDIIGSAFPGAPSVVFGHNGKVAWAPTIGFQDITDFYVEFADPTDRSRVIRPWGSLPTIERQETFKIRKDDNSFEYETVVIKDIPGHGPILPAELLPIPLPVKVSIRWAGASLPGPVGAVFDLSKAGTVDDIFTALRTFRGGTIGFAMADNANNIAYSLWTLTPKRKPQGRFSPWFVIPGDVGPHWEGFLPFEAIPFLINPSSGYIRSANGDPSGNTLDNNPGNDRFYYGFAYALGYRCEQLDRELKALTERGGVTMPELEKVQQTRQSIFAEQLIPYFKQAVTRRADLIAANSLTNYADAVTLHWDQSAAEDSTGATIFYPWAFQFVGDMYLDESDFFENRLGGGEMQVLVPGLMHFLEKTQPFIDQINNGKMAFPSNSGRNLFDDLRTNDKIETRDELIINALKKTITHLKTTFTNQTNGPEIVDPNDLSTWQWKKILYLRSRHSLSRLDESLEEFDELRGTGGNFDTPNVASYTAIEDGVLPDRFILGNAPSNRYLWEMKPDGIAAKFMVPWGQSEIPGNTHYLDLVPDYVDHVYRDFPYTDNEIEATLESTLVLQAGKN